MGLMLAVGVVCASGSNLHQYRFGAGLQWEIQPHWKLAVRQDFRYTEGNDLGFYYRATDLEALYAGLASWLDLGLGFKTVFAEASTHETLRQNRPYGSLIVKGDIQGMNINNRVITEYRDNESLDDFWSFRNRFRLRYPLVAGSWEFAPYLSDELFFYFNDTYDDFKSNRIKAGVTMAPVRIFIANVYYFWERGKGYTLQALGGTVTIRF